MSLESATYINGLVSSNPQGTDPRSAGDDHIRLLKTTIKATFPNIDAPITSTEDELNILDGVTANTAELNYCDGVTSNIQTQIDSKQATLTSTSNGYGTKTISTANPSGGTDGDIWYKVS